MTLTISPCSDGTGKPAYHHRPPRIVPGVVAAPDVDASEALGFADDIAARPSEPPQLALLAER